MKKYPSVTVVLLNYNGIDYTRNCIYSVLKTTYTNFTILVGDNGSKNNEAVQLAEEFKGKKIIIKPLKKNWGFSVGNNKILQFVKSKYVVFLNNDTIVTPSWLLYLVKQMESDQKIAACQPKTLLMDDESEFDYAGACGGFIDKYGYPFTRGRVFFTSEKDNGQYDNSRDLFWASGVCMMLRRDTFVKAGMFDKIYFLYMEEIDISWKLLRKGFKLHSVPKSIIYHKVAGTNRKTLFKKKFFEHRNNLVLIVKNYSHKDLLILFPRRLIFELITILYYFLKLDFTSFFALISAHFSFWKFFPQILKLREKTLPNITSFKGLVYDGSIVIDYFILRKRKFSQIMKSS